VAAMIEARLDERIYPVVKVATVVDALAAEGVSPDDALAGAHLSSSAIYSPATRVSLNQVIECYSNAARLSRDRRFAYRAGLRFHVSTYGMYGFAILSSTNFRQTMNFAVRYHQLAAPLAEITFAEADGLAVWTIDPIPHPRVDAALYKFLVELQFGIHLSLHRDVMGSSFLPRELRVTYPPPDDAQDYAEAFGCKVTFGQAHNELLFEAACLDRAPQLGNEITYSALKKLCDELLDDLRLRVGLVGKVREILLVNLLRPTSFEAVAEYLHMTTRTLRRKLRDEGVSFRQLVDELRMQVAIKYLRDTDLTIEEIAHALGFSDAANFRHAFRRWSKGAPLEFRDRLRAG
jgi:AraC-like DNA-binding protein